MPTYHDATNQLVTDTAQPVRASRLESEVLVPLAQTLITLLFVALDVLLWTWRPLAGAVGCVALFVWGWRILRSDRLMWRLERLTQHDLTGDGSIGQPPASAIALINPVVARTTAGNWQPVHSDQERMTQFVLRCDLHGTSEKNHGVKPGSVAHTNYVECRDALFALGVAAWRDWERPTLGWRLTVDVATATELVRKHVF
jgi:hypothetical protein